MLIKFDILIQELHEINVDIALGDAESKTNAEKTFNNKIPGLIDALEKQMKSELNPDFEKQNL